MADYTIEKLKDADGNIFAFRDPTKATPSDITNAINALDVNDSAVANQFVTKVSETDGKISVIRAQPTIANVSGLQTALDGKFDGFIADSTGFEDTTSVLVAGNSGTKIKQRSASKLWDYIKSKISSVLGLTVTNYSGKAATAGTADNATKLSTARTINVDTAVVGTAKSFDGSANISIPVTSVKEAYLSWGGKTAVTGGVTPVDAGCIDEFGHNKLAFIDPTAITVEYSNDGGTTWIDYGLSNEDKIKFTTLTEAWCYLAKNSSTVDARNGTLTNENVGNYLVRVTVSTRNSSRNAVLYTSARKVILNFGTNGATGCYVTAQTRTIGDYNNNIDNWTTRFSKQPITGWSGWNSYEFNTSFGGGSTQTSQIAELRLIFGATGVSTSYASRWGVGNIRMIGVTNWTMPSDLAKNGSLYSIDANKIAYFPNKLYAKHNSSTNYEVFDKSMTIPIANGGTGNTTGKATDSDKLGGQLPSHYATKSEIPDVSGKENTSNKVTTLDNSTTHYPSTSAVTTALSGKQDTISDIATIRSNATNGQTAYGWGNHANAGYLTEADLSGYETSAHAATTYVPKSDIVDAEGDSRDKVMSQYGVKLVEQGLSDYIAQVVETTGESLDTKANKDGSNATGTWPISVTGTSDLTKGLIINNASSNKGICVKFPSTSDYYNFSLYFYTSKGAIGSTVIVRIQKGHGAAPTSFNAEVLSLYAGSTNAPVNVGYEMPNGNTGDLYLYVYPTGTSNALYYAVMPIGSTNYKYLEYTNPEITTITAKTLVKPDSGGTRYVFKTGTAAVGSSTQPVYVNADGKVLACTYKLVVGSVDTSTNTISIV